MELFHPTDNWYVVPAHLVVSVLAWDAIHMDGVVFLSLSLHPFRHVDPHGSVIPHGVTPTSQAVMAALKVTSLVMPGLVMVTKKRGIYSPSLPNTS